MQYIYMPMCIFFARAVLWLFIGKSVKTTKDDEGRRNNSSGELRKGFGSLVMRYLSIDEMVW